MKYKSHSDSQEIREESRRWNLMNDNSQPGRDEYDKLMADIMSQTPDEQFPFMDEMARFFDEIHAKRIDEHLLMKKKFIVVIEEFPEYKKTAPCSLRLIKDETFQKRMKEIEDEHGREEKGS